MKDKRYCGACCWFKHEDIDGYGICVQCNKPLGDVFGCNHVCHCGEFVSEEQKRHYMATILVYLRQKAHGCFDGEAKWPDQLDKPLKFAFKYLKAL